MAGGAGKISKVNENANNFLLPRVLRLLQKVYVILNYSLRPKKHRKISSFANPPNIVPFSALIPMLKHQTRYMFCLHLVL